MEDQRHAEMEQTISEINTTEIVSGPDLAAFMKRLENAKKGLEVQKQDGNWDYDPYMHGMLNGMEFVLATVEDREAEFRDGPDKWRTGDLTEFVEDLAKFGTRFDHNPTMRFLKLNKVEYYNAEGVRAYIRRIDGSVRDRALAALTFEPQEEVVVVTPELDTYICSECNGKFKKTLSDEEAFAADKLVFGDALTRENAAVVCEDCFKKITEVYPLADDEPVDPYENMRGADL